MTSKPAFRVLSSVYVHLINSSPCNATRCHSSSSSAVELFREERLRQLSTVKRLEKIRVECVGIGDSDKPVQLSMNKHLSTPYSCTKHVGEPYIKQSALSLVNGVPWHMHEPLTENCQLEFLHFRQDDPTLVNTAFWRSCSYLLGSVLQRAFKPEHSVQLVQPRDFAVESGSFAYDFTAKLGEWEPTEREQLLISQMATKLAHGKKGKANTRSPYFIQPLRVSIEKAKEMFHNNKHKLAQIDRLSSTKDKVTVYQMGAHLDLIDGPLISSVEQLGRFNLTAIHKLEELGKGDCLYRAQGVALPTTITMHSWTYKALLHNATKLNQSEELWEEEDVSDASMESDEKLEGLN